MFAVLAATTAGCVASNPPPNTAGDAMRDATHESARATAAPLAPLYGNLGDHTRTISTESPEAQRYFDQGLTLAFSFNHDEAIRSFKQAAAHDPDCAMAWWGVALANGPHINNPVMDAAQAAAAWDAMVNARARAEHATALERELIDAVGARYAHPAPADRRALDEAFADAMRRLWRAHPDDADIGCLTAEALMDLQPWDLWTRDGAPKLATNEILSTLEAVMKLDPSHPGANHLYVHAVEASPQPERGVPPADRLRTLVPGAGHMVHMPAHIYSRVGRWADASESNVRAIEADRAYRARSPEQGFYRIYMAHNHHFLSWSSMMEGRSVTAIGAARDMLAGMPADFIEAFAFFADGYTTIALEALMRFGRWEEILAEPQPPAYLPIATAHRRFARAIALGALGRLDEARAEQIAFAAASAHVTDAMIVGNNSAKHVLAIADHMLAGEIFFFEGRIDESIERLREGVRLEDELKYNESPDWIQPVRHTLGAVLLEAGRPAEAAEVYRADLVKNPNNGWSLYGLAQCARARVREAQSIGNAPGARAAERDALYAEARFEQAWSRADVRLHATCFCVPKG
ncbi:MAG: tetratricopeptide repeat protein [bacterium]